jgi:Major capsid protein Gp23
MKNLFESKWNETKALLTEGKDLITNQDGSYNDSKKRNMMIMLENTRKILRESSDTTVTQSSNVDSLNKVILSVMRRVMPTVIANEIMGVQAMTGPIGQINTFRAKYAEAYGGVVAGAEALSPYAIAKAYSGNGDLVAPGASPTSVLEGTMGRRLSGEVVKTMIEAKSRRLGVRWTIEAAQDAQNEYGINLESEMLNLAATEMVTEIDQEMLGNLRSIAGTPTMVFDMSTRVGQPIFVGDVHASLATMINFGANRIASRTRRNAGNWVVLSPVALTILQSAKTSAFARTTEGTFSAPSNTKFVGVLNGAQKVYVDQYAPDTTPVLVGLKESDSEAAAYYCPYIPMQATQVITDPNTGEMVAGFLTRYGYAALTADPANKSFQNAKDYLFPIGIDATKLVWM